MTSATAVPERPLFGSLVLSKGFCTLDELDAALDLQRSAEPHPRLGEVFVDMGKLTPEQVKELLALQGAAPRLVQEAGPALEARVLAAGERLRIGDVVLRTEGVAIEIVSSGAPTSRTPRPTTIVVPPENPARKGAAAAHALVGRLLPFLHPQRTYALLAALPGLVALVLPWRLWTNGVWSYGVQGPGWITFLLSSAAAAWLLLGDRPRPLARREKLGVLALSGLALLLALWKLFSTPSGAAAMGLGVPLALISAALLQIVTWPMKAVDGDPGLSAWARIRRGLGELSGKGAKERAEKLARRETLLRQAGEAALKAPAESDPEPVKKARQLVDAPGKPVPGKRERALARLGRAAVDAGLADLTLAEEVKALDQVLTKMTASLR